MTSAQNVANSKNTPSCDLTIALFKTKKAHAENVLFTAISQI